MARVEIVVPSGPTGFVNIALAFAGIAVGFGVDVGGIGVNVGVKVAVDLNIPNIFYAEHVKHSSSSSFVLFSVGSMVNCCGAAFAFVLK